MRRAMLLCAIVVAAITGQAKAELLSFSQNIVADFEFSLLPGTPIYGGSTMTPPIPFQAIGFLTFEFDSLLNDPSQPTSVAITGFSGVLQGVSPSNFMPFTISPNLQFVGGSLTDIVRDVDGNVTSANITNLSAFWEMIGPGGIRLYGSEPLLFSGAVGSLPFGYGTVLSGPEPFDVYLDDGDASVPDILVAIGQNRTLRAVPEPSSMAMLGLGAMTLVGMARRKLAAR